jgi:hypothetical protein
MLAPLSTRAKCAGAETGSGEELKVDDWIIDVVPGRQTNDGLGRLAGDEAEASFIADEVYGNPCFAKVFADGREIRDLEDSAGDVVH